jgi:hypothetical protein
MIWCYRQPTLADMLSDPVTRAVMDADDVNPRELETMLTEMECELRVMRRTGQGRTPRISAYHSTAWILSTEPRTIAPE